ncbi:MAG: ABC-F family ATP-binding cassette domain-containing protein [Alphaproteobacteria bacterium]|nr:ABC-F family ATP-binding cassette domain-containing protein [Alphaproteobacteria bacterium]
MLRIANLTYRIGARVLLDEVDATIGAGERVGLVGLNGTGKSTLLRLIAGEIEADGGAIEIPARWRIGITRQEAPHGAGTLVDYVLAADRELTCLNAEAESATDPERIGAIHARLADKDAYSARARAARILAGLGFDAAAQAQELAAFSGGWRMRVALAALLFTEPELLLLDEPTNHLDLEASLWLEGYLKRYPGTVVIVSHDRDLLNRAVDSILHLERLKLTLYRGGYDRFEETRRMRLELDEKRRRKQEAQRAHIQAFVDRFRYKASKARQAQSRLKMLERLQPLPDITEDAAGVVFDFPEPETIAPPLYSLDNVSVGYDGKPVLAKLSLRLDADDRIALLGANGNGKSTFAKLLAERLAPQSGRVVRSNKLRVGYFAQHQFEELDLAATPIVAMARKRPRDPVERLRAHLGRFGLSQERAATLTADLSGGEKARLVFALMTCDRPHILLLDEPTNHLDLASRESLIQALNEFPGAVVLISHDPHVIELTADRLWLVKDGQVTPYDGDLEDYRASMSGANEAGGGKAKGPARSTGDRRGLRRQAAARREALAPLKRKVADAERAVERLAAECARIEAALSAPTTYDDPARAAALQREIGQIRKDLARAEEGWLALQAEFESLSAEAS